MNLEMEVFESIDAPMAAAEGIGMAMMAMGAGILVGLVIT